jgi:predicted AAA+ superfamily ATPase
MFERLLNPTKSNHFFLFGARGTGKSTLLKHRLDSEKTLFLDLLSAKLETQLSRDPDQLAGMVHALPDAINTVVIDEIQKVPRLLDVVHALIEEKQKRFILTGSSARKLKYGGANLLAGRAFFYHLFPLSVIELDDKFDLLKTLQFGTLPKLFELKNDDERSEFLIAYAHTYVKEEIFAEQLVKLLDPFRRFLEVAAQSNGKIINIANISRDVGVDDKTVQSYFSILEDTLVGFMLEPFHHSFRRRLSHKPKFYFFDLGVAHALGHTLSIPMVPSSSAFGDAFEHFVILECMKLASYARLQYKYSYIHTKDGAEIDLVVERPGKPLLCIEIKSSAHVGDDDLRNLRSLSKDLPNSEAVCFCRETIARKSDGVLVLPWFEGLQRYFSIG